MELDADIGSSRIRIRGSSSSSSPEGRTVGGGHPILEEGKMHFYRVNNNHAYVGGRIEYGDDCSNLLVVSPYRETVIEGIRNCAIFVKPEGVQKIPFISWQDLTTVAEASIGDASIEYHKPVSVATRENLPPKDKGDLVKNLNELYGLEVQRFNERVNARSKGAIFELTDNTGQEFFLKYRGNNKERAEALGAISNLFPDFFPEVVPIRNSGRLTFALEERLYGLERRINGSSLNPAEKGYHVRIGRVMAKLHNLFFDFRGKIESALGKREEGSVCFYDSRAISLYIDLLKAGKFSRPFIPDLDTLMHKAKEAVNLPESIIHGDLNSSNLLIERGSVKIVDLETMRVSARLSEFEAPALFRGNMARPKYKSESLIELVEGYNAECCRKLGEKERVALPLFLRLALLRNFVIRAIRRREVYPEFPFELIHNLDSIEELV